jgi:hypothetical protein
MTWYVVITCVFRCPPTSNELDANSPQICNPYLRTVSYLKPHLEPYYNTYAAPYVEITRPYAQKLDQKVINPASQIAKHNYLAYAAPRIERAKAFGQQQWEKSILPQVLTAQKKAQDIYGASVAPHINKASSFVEPYYGIAKDNALNVHQKHVMPAFETSKPYLRDAYGASQTLVLDTGIPYARWVWSSIVIFVDGTLWPQMRALYGDNVKPQLVMISERIAKYQEGRKLKASMDKVESSISAAMDNTETIKSATTEVTIGSSVATPMLIPETHTTSEEPASTKTSRTSEEQIAAARDKIAKDLHNWQEKFAKAADKGSEDLQERVKEIIDGLIRSEVRSDGTGLLTALNLTVEQQIIKFKSEVVKVVSNLPEEPTKSDEETAGKQLQDSIRRSANSIRDRASAVRQWHIIFEANVAQRAGAAADSTLDVLDSIRDLGLQEIGMRWAWMEGVTYKDWAKYHKLKKQFDHWRNEVREVATKHEAVEDAKKAGDAILEEAMDIAQKAAMELVRLKDVAKWKIHAHDATDNFESRAMPAGAASAASKVADNINSAGESLVGNGQATMSSVGANAADAASDVVSNASSAVMGTSQGTMESMASKATEVAAVMADSASSAVMGSSQGVVESMVSEATKSAAAIASDASAAIGQKSNSGIYDQAASSAQSVASQVDDSASSAAASIASAASFASEAVSSGTVASASSIASSASRKVFGGAMAQKVSDRAPIFDDIIDDSDEATFSEKVQGIVNNAGDRYADVTNAVSEAILGRTQGTLESVSSVASEQYSSALAAASSVLYGTTQGTAESITSVASEKYSQAVSA